MGLIQGVKVSAKTHLSHLLFVEYVMMFAAATLHEWRNIKEILHLFFQVLGINFSDNKSVLMSSWGDEVLARDISAMLNFQLKDFNDGMKYLGYFIKPNNYRASD